MREIYICAGMAAWMGYMHVQAGGNDEFYAFVE